MSTLLEGVVLGAHRFTAHASPGLESVTPGLYARTESGFTAGALRNCHARLSVYAGWTFETRSRRFALTLGGITGYDAATVLPVVVPSVRLPLGDAGRTAARLSYLPKQPNGGSSHALHLSVERRF